MPSLPDAIADPEVPPDADAQAGTLAQQALDLARHGRWREARERFEQALARAPGDLDIRTGYARALQARQLPGEAEPHFERVLAADPTHRAALAAYCEMLAHASDGLAHTEALCRRALALEPGHLPARLALAGALLSGLQQDAGHAILEELIAAGERDPQLLSLYMFYAGYSDRVPPGRLAQIHEAFGRGIAARAGKPADRAQLVCEALARRAAAPAGAPLRVAILTADAWTHPVGQLLASFVGEVDRSRAQLTLYASTPVEDEVTAALRAGCERYVDVAGWSDAQLREQALHDGVDVLVDAIGMTGGNRLEALARRCAPVQLAWAGYVHSTGLPTMDGYIADATTSAWPAERLFREPVYRLPGCVYAWRPVAPRPEVAPAPVLRNGFVTFGAYNNLAKVNGTTLDLWCAVLRALPDARLRMKAAALADTATRERVTQAFAQRGIEAARITLDRPSTYADFAHEFAHVDAMLDCFPFNGGMTTIDALWQGVPLLALEGPTHASRVGMSLMRAVGLDGWIARSGEDCVALARRHAADPQALAALRATLRGRVQATIGDTRRFAAQMVAVWEDAWHAAVREAQAG